MVARGRFARATLRHVVGGQESIRQPPREENALLRGNLLPMSPPSNAAALRNRFSPSPPVLAASLAIFLAGVMIAPFFSMTIDTHYYFLSWAQESRGFNPFRLYEARADCNYPALWLYVLTGVEKLRLLFHAPPHSPGAVLLLKLPSLLALAGAVPMAERWLREPFGADAARRGAVALAFGLSLWVNAAIWGQADVPLAVLLIGAALALLHARPVLAGVLAGFALALKLQAIFAIPFLIVYAWRRFGGRMAGFALATGILTVVLLSLPFFLHSRASGTGLIRSYTGAVGFYHRRSNEAFNIWHLSKGFDNVVRHLPAELANDDRVPYIGPLTPRQIGLSLFVAAYLPLLWRLWRNPSPQALLFSIALGFIVFFMFPTQVHSRYVQPGIAFLALLYGVSPGVRRLYPFWNITTTVNIGMALVYTNWMWAGTLAKHNRGIEKVLFTGGSVLTSVAQVVLLVLLYRAFWRETEPIADMAEKPAP